MPGVESGRGGRLRPRSGHGDGSVEEAAAASSSKAEGGRPKKRRRIFRPRPRRVKKTPREAKKQQVETASGCRAPLRRGHEGEPATQEGGSSVWVHGFAYGKSYIN
uniref:Uncharacterized protein n=1 Tax=Oryza rufipogon TaxID=4529 RepID=A0A0E0NX36_ORYRU